MSKAKRFLLLYKILSKLVAENNILHTYYRHFSDFWHFTFLVFRNFPEPRKRRHFSPRKFKNLWPD